MENVREHETSGGAMECFKQALEEVENEGSPWLAAVWRIKDGKIEMGRVTTSSFPHGDFLACVGHLALHLFERMKQVSNASMTPLPRAPFFGKQDFVTGKISDNEGRDVGGGTTDEPE